MLPTEQCLDTADVAIFEIQNGLIDEEEFPPVECRAEIDLQPQSIDNVNSHLRFESDVAVLPQCLGPVQGNVCVPQQLLCG